VEPFAATGTGCVALATVAGSPPAAATWPFRVVGGRDESAAPALSRPDGVEAEANAVDDKGTVAGYVTPNGQPRRAVLWSCVV
jgi:hypothetical protein